MAEAAVRIQEVDLSSRVASFEGVYGAIVVQSKKGNTKAPTFVTNNQQFLEKLTPRNKVEVGYDLAHYSALAYLARSDKLFVARASNGSQFGGAAIKERNANTDNNALRLGFGDVNSYLFDSQLDVVGIEEKTKVVTLKNDIIPAIAQVLEIEVTSDDISGSYNNQFFKLPYDLNKEAIFWFNVNSGSSQPVDAADTYVEITLDENDPNTTILNKILSAVQTLNEFTTSVSGLTITAESNTVGEVSSSLASSTDVTVTESIEGKDLTYTLQDKSFLIHDEDGSVEIHFSIDGLGSGPHLGADRAIEVAFNGAKSSDEVAILIRDELNSDGKFIATTRNNELFIKDIAVGPRIDASDSNTGFVITVEEQGSDDVNEDDEALLIYASSEGAWINDIGIRIITHLDDGDLVPEENSFLIEVYKREFQGTPVESFFVSRIIGKLDGYGRNMYIEDVLKGSSFIRALNNDLVDEEIYPKSQNDILWLGGGDDGILPTTANMIQAANQFSNEEQIPVTILMDGGYAVPAYGQALDTIAKTRMDCVAILSTPFEKENESDYIEAIREYRKDELNLNSSYSALYSPHVLIQDEFNDRELFIAPDGFVAASISFNANSREIWFPPAGYRRGIINVLDVKVPFTSGERSILYSIGVNPIKKTSGQGIVIWGQKTLSSRPSMLDRLNVRLLLIVISPAIKAFLEDYLFEFNDRITRSEVEQKVSDYLMDIQSRRGVTRFQVICDETNNTPTVIDQNKLICDVLITPSSSIEDIPLRIVLVSNSMSFSDASQAV